MKGYDAIVIGTSLGGHRALKKILQGLPKEFPLPIAIVQHLSPDSDGVAVDSFCGSNQILVKEAEDKEEFQPGMVYLAPPNYHLLIEMDSTISLSVDEKENYSRPSIDVLFESAAKVFGKGLIGVVLTGANSDGASGLKMIHEEGGLTIVQEPGTAEAREMPEAAIRATKPDHIFPLEEMAPFLCGLKAKAGGVR